MSVLTETEKAWLACAIDSEGSIVIGKGRVKKKHVIFVPMVNLSNTHQGYIDHARELINRVAGNSYTSRAHKSSVHKVVHRIGVMSFPRVTAILKEILPYLIIKKDRADNILAWAIYRDERRRNGRPFYDEGDFKFITMGREIATSKWTKKDVITTSLCS